MAKKKITIRCPKCDYENAPDAKFCQNCGSSLQPACPACGTLNRAGAKFCKSCGAKLEDSAQPSPEKRLSHLQQAAPQALQQKIQAARLKMDSERKPVAILFTDIAGSTALAEKLDPEDWREIVTGAHQVVIDAVYKYEGTVAQLLGDGVLAFFGAPVTHEDDPLRAVHAGLEIQQGIDAYGEKVKGVAPDFRMRVGISAGLVVVGNIGSDLHIEYLAIGDAVNLAARLQSMAPPGEVVISDSIFQPLAHAIECDDLGLFTIKGKQDPVHIYQVNAIRDEPILLRESVNTGRAMVGREVELGSLKSLTEAVQAGIGRVALIIGEPGVGKSRLVTEWKSWVETNFPETMLWVESHCPSYGKSLAYGMVIDLLHSTLDNQATTTKKDTLFSLKVLCQNLFGDAALDTYAYLSHLMGLELEEKELDPIHGMDPRALQIQYLAAIQRLFRALSAQKPLVLICEDVHWADPSSVDLLIKLLPLTQDAPVFFCFTSRQVLDVPGWQLVTAARTTLGARLTELPLMPLSPGHTDQMIANLLGMDASPLAVSKLVYEKTEGNPLFVEEVMRTLVEERGLVRTDAGWAIGEEIRNIEIPDNLKRLVMARIDRLDGETKHVMRVASVIGRQFLVRVLERVLVEGQQPEGEQLLVHLSNLETTDLIRLMAAIPDVVYLFKHALIHEAVYESVLKADRKVLHRVVAQAMEMIYPERLEELASTLGYHYYKGGVHDKAVRYLARAAETAKARYANQEAIALYRTAIEEAELEVKVEEQAESWLEKLADLRENLGEVLSFSGQHEEAIRVYGQALDIIPASNRIMRSRIYRKIGNTWMIPRRSEEAVQAFDQSEAALGALPEGAEPALLNAWIDLQLDRVWAYYFLGRIPEMVTLVQKVRPSIETHGSPLARARFFRNLVLLAYRRDRFQVSDETVNDAQKSLDAARESGEKGDITFSTFVYGFSHLWRRELDVAEEYLKATLDLSEKIGDMERNVLSLTYLTVLYRQRNQVEMAAQLAARAMEAASTCKMPGYVDAAKANQVWVLWRNGKYTEAEQIGRELIKKDGHKFGPTAMLIPWPLVDIHLKQGRKAEAVDVVSQMMGYMIQKIPGLEEAMQRAVDAWKYNDEAAAMRGLAEAMEIARANLLM